MPMSPEAFHGYALRAADADGRLPLSRMADWDVFPFEQEGLRVVRLARPQLPEPARNGEDGSRCDACAGGRPVIWSDDNWRLWVLRQSGVPLALQLESRSHYDLPGLPEDLAGEFGRLVVHTTRAIESLPHIARAHVSRWGDGGAHMHVWFFARPAGFSQLQGTCLAIWDDLLPAVPDAQREGDAAAVAAAISRSFGGQAVSTPA